MKIKKINQSAGVIADVVNSLDSNSSIDALSANMGKQLNEKIEAIPSQEITFTIDGTSYYALRGMTWYEWKSSVYNTIGASTLYGGSNVVWQKSGTRYFLKAGVDNVPWINTIIGTYAYTSESMPVP